MLSLVSPDQSFQQEWQNVVDGWDESRKRPRIFFQENFSQFLDLVHQLELGDDETRQLAKSSVLLLIQEGNKKILGCTWIRQHIKFATDSLYNGHIGYGIPPDERGKGYATEILKLSLIEAKRFGLEKILIACDDDNLASAKVIEKNGGEFESYNYEDGIKRRRYWIDLK